MNVFENIVINRENEEFKELLNQKSIRVERIVSNGQYSEENFWYNQDENEFIVLLDGDAIIEFQEYEVKLKKGDTLNIKAHKKHRVKYTSKKKPTIWLAIFY